MELWAYAPKAHPKRVPEELKEPLRFAQEKWRADFILRRQLEYQQLAKLELKPAQERWIEEQKQYPWIYGAVLQPLDLDV